MMTFAQVARRQVLTGMRGGMVTRSFKTTPRTSELSKFMMPAMSPTMTEGGIASWKVKEGDTFAAGDVLVEIETDKATIDVEASDDGVMAKIMQTDGAKSIPVGSPIAIIGEEGDDISGADALASESSSSPASSSSSSSESESKPSESSSSSSSSSSDSPKVSDVNKMSEEEKERKDTHPGTVSGGGAQALQTAKDETKYGSGGGTEKQGAPELGAKAAGGDKPKFFASPAARKMALEKGVPLGSVKGTGPEGRILKEDVEKYQPSAASSSSSSSTAKPTTPGKSPLPGQPAPAAPAEYEDIPVTNMRKTIGKRLTESKQMLPHYYLTVEIEMDRIMKLREMFNKAGDGKNKLSVNDFIVKATALALSEVPEANSAWLGEVIRQYKRADICVAVATPNGLITPIIKDATSKGLATISSETKSLAVRAREGKLKPEEYQGGTFTISNLGMFGIDNFTAIINPPQSCILAIGATTKKIVVDETSERGWKEVSVMKASLSSDHRTVDGAVGARWLKAFKGYMEQPLTFML